MCPTPDPVRDAPAQVVRDREREQELHGDDAEARPQRPVGGAEGDDELAQRERHGRVERDPEDVDADERARKQPQEAVHLLDAEARQARQVRPTREREAEGDRGRQEDVGDDAAGAGRVPRHGARDHVHAGFRLAGRRCYAARPGSP